MKEIEKKYLINKLPDLSKARKLSISQYYINISPDPIIRARKIGYEFFLTYKSKIDSEKQVHVCEEYELPITSEIYNKLSKCKIGNEIIKTRYVLSINDLLKAEIDVFDGHLKGLSVAEVEFKTIEDAENFIPPSWFGKDITGVKKFINSQLAIINNLEEIKEIFYE